MNQMTQTYLFPLSLRPQRFWAVGRPATSQNFPIYLTRAHSELCRKTFADALVCMGIPGEWKIREKRLYLVYIQDYLEKEFSVKIWMLIVAIVPTNVLAA